jgi:hypothetical protein
MIQFHCGRWRWVIVLPPLGIVLKFPRFYPLEWLKSDVFKFRYIGRILWQRQWTSLKVLWAYQTHPESGFVRYSIGGLSDNFGEWLFYLQHPHPFLQPTYFSFFGLVNVQRYGAPLDEAHERETDRMKRWGQITEWGVYKDSHTFGSNQNFCLDRNGHTHILDYGQRKTQRVLLRWADSLCIGFRTDAHRRSPE